ncbi:MAG: DUF928 domain-containing protein, partial [Spirulinaceae cyanobacterium]
LSTEKMLKTLSYLLGLSTFLLLSSTPSLLAQPTSSPADQGGSGDPPPRTAGTGSRGDGSCEIDDPNSPEPQSALTAIVPQPNILSTQQERVNLYFFIPPETSQPAFLEIIDRQTKELVFEQEFELKNENSIARLVLPDTIQLSVEPPVDRLYQWNLQIYCVADSAADNEPILHLSGWIHWLVPDPAATEPTMLWHENMESWLMEREAQPQSAWRQRLAAEGLEQYADLDIHTYVLGLDSASSDSTQIKPEADTDHETQTDNRGN